MAAAAALLLCSSLAGKHSYDRKHINGDFKVSQTGGYEGQTVQTVPYWTDKPPRERVGSPPYVPPKDWIYNTTGGPVAGKINVHLVPHSHDDTGWQVTVDQYFYEEVYYILDTLIVRLDEDSNRRFMFVETGFFARWWDQQPTKKKDLTKRLVAEGRLEFVNGGWCMHDEASPFYVEMIDQTTRGHQFLNANFGEHGRPKGTWSIDPFGHSNTNAWLLGAEAGMDYIFWGRSDYQDFAARKKTKGLEWIWEGSASLGASAQVFAGDLFGGGEQGYGTWFGFDGTSQQIRDDPERHDYNIDKYVDQFVQHARVQAGSYKTEHQMWACGSDFNYQNADHWYHNLDKLVHYINQNGSVNAFYSTPTFYVEQKKKAGVSWEVRRDDIFPLGDAAHHYWSGYFTSRPALKKQVHVASNFLNAARQLEMVSGVNRSQVKVTTERPSPVVGTSWTDSLEGTVGVATHHDGMSGTERQDVADDYAQRISESHGEVEDGVSLSLQKLMGVTAGFQHCNCNSMNGDNCLNITMCTLTTVADDRFTVAAWNPLGRDSTQILRVPVTLPSGKTWTVTQPAGVKSQLTAIDSRTLELPKLYLNKFNMTASQIQKREEEMANKATHVLSFQAALPAVGFSTFVAELVAKKAEVPSASVAAAAGSISNEVYTLEYDAAKGTTVRLTNKVSGETTPFDVAAGFYNSSKGGCTPGVNPKIACDPQKSGAYIFRSNSSRLFYPGPTRTPTLTVVKGNLTEEVHQVWSEWATAVYRLHKGQRFLEVEWTVGPIPIDTPWIPNDSLPGKEVVMRYSTGLRSNGTFYTDSNGREMVKRQYNARGPSYPKLVVNEPVAGNYYPVNAMIAVQDKSAQLSVLTDVSQAGSSQMDGSIELMVHRRLQIDDNRGVQEPLNETMCGCNDINAGEAKMGEHGHEGDGGCVCAGLTMRSKHLVIFDTIEQANSVRRQAMEELSFPATLAFANGDVKPKVATKSFLSKALPEEIKLLTLNPNYVALNGGRVILRLTHLYQTGESKVHSVPVTVDLNEVFSHEGLKLVDLHETQLTATYALKDMDKQKFRWETHTPNPGVAHQLAEHQCFPERDYLADFKVTIRPMEVRTYLATFTK